MRDDLLKSFNDQFATNQNHGQLLFIQFLSAILVVLIGYGYIYANTSPEAKIWVTMRDPKSTKDIVSYAVTHLFGALLISELILTLLATVVLNIGYSFRRDQLVIYKLRKATLGEEYKDMFGTMSFNPSGQNFWDFLPEFNRMFIFGIATLQTLLLISFFIFTYHSVCWTAWAIWCRILVCLIALLPGLWTCWLYSNYYKKYYWIMSDSTVHYSKVSKAERLKKREY
ncbi:hypothetical protein KXD93_25620 [Mucilaginibacter sp. BJC16-A38]|uniref:hypothetical protein n=1 Tax=Mucilaginibacter phenanthrenivorans TaxID=1234842 RepID=UPI0021575163|nr:hypothetical protein [Mucilaginibacter phenanthrenivorans]MCR8561062.1 hypothetical protein [Mucilaginibacter phenanthrenivorans]